jgi:HSP20 family protein
MKQTAARVADLGAAIKTLRRTETRLNIMSTLLRWNPFKETEDLNNRLLNLFNLAPVQRSNGTNAVANWSPLVDVTEDDKEYHIKAELPEVRKEDVKVIVENGLLTISGERKFEQEQTNKRYCRVERAYGSFTRYFTVPEDADDTQVSAEFKDGVLNVRLAKSEKAKPKSVEVKVA